MLNLTKTQKICIQYGFLLLLICMTVYLVSTTLDITLIPLIMKLVNKKFIFIGFLIMVLYIILECTIINILIKTIQKTKVRFLAVKIAMMGFYYNLVTPFASGSQPMQIYALNKYDINLSKSIAIVTNKTVLFQTVVTIYSAVIIFLNIDVLKNELPSILVLMSIGMVMNIVSLLGGMLIVLSPNTMKIIVKVIVNILYRLKIFKSLNKKIHTINRFIDEYSYSIKLFIKNKKALCLSIILTIIQLTVFFSISYCVYKAFNLNGLSLFDVLALQVFLYMSVSPIPTPGNVGANEVAFLTIFSNVFPGNIIGYSVFLYSIYVYYFLVVVCGLFTIHTHYHMNKRKNKNRNYSL
ncbi:MAG: lysylphosphatidylglycerol synthase transmembrane domain-containing protein [Romboutsia timonensis]|uniref:lysylphosphatidylglycerol synthase transmembrane domain-containing protein n=1 Tax=Romboutsia timonensis TaxID=1776391 RepID=UPI002A7665B3|nr:lysylphosphatidylglycerol synthase transmembrane domain-containing protein [Romboutsia timonensis]MCI6668239.1 flippase-like domain-containing protein [Romboutsia timonensis]MDY3000383.1 lysylphosphatidylglycerol synthase transmembrane domain-containing protein [Romboutsia timonensis]